MRILIYMINSFGIKRRSTTFEGDGIKRDSTP